MNNFFVEMSNEELENLDGGAINWVKVISGVGMLAGTALVVAGSTATGPGAVVVASQLSFIAAGGVTAIIDGFSS